MKSRSSSPPKLPRLKLLDDVYDRRNPERVGRFNGWALGNRAIVCFRGGGRMMIPAEHVTSRRIEAGKKLGATDKPSRKIQKLAKANAHLQPLAAKFGLTVEEYLDAIS